MTETKEDILKQIYFNVDSGYGSIADTTRQAKHLNASITQQDVKRFLDKLKHRQVQHVYKSFNSFVSPHPLFELEVDLIDLANKSDSNDGFKYIFIAIDNFTKFAHAVPIKTKTPNDIVPAMEEVLTVIGVPKQLYSDQEGAFENNAFVRLMNKHMIKHIKVVSGAHTVERLIRTIKEHIFRRLDANDENHNLWLKYLKPVITKYNNTKHNTIHMTPTEARNDDKQLTVSFNLHNHAKRNRNYPDLSVGDTVRVLLKTDKNRKGYMPKWSVETYKVMFISGQYYRINTTKRKVYIRHELLKVDVQSKLSFYI
jgi:hypothetical protein